MNYGQCVEIERLGMGIWYGFFLTNEFSARSNNAGDYNLHDKNVLFVK